MFENQAFGPEQREARRIGIVQVCLREQLTLVEPPFGIRLLLVRFEFVDFPGIEKIDFGDADAVLARNHAVQRHDEPHDARHRVTRFLQHLVVVGVDRDIGVHVAVAGVHMQRHEHAAAQHRPVHGVDLLHHLLELPPAEDIHKLRAHLALP